MLEPLSDAEFADFAQTSIQAFAHTMVAAGRWPDPAAPALAAQDFQALLPDGLATRNHHVMKLVPPGTGTTVGWLWWAELERAGWREAFVFDLVVFEAFRRQGHARAALRALETLARAQGMTSIGLHVFEDNASARRLYATLGFQTTSLNLNKRLTTR